MVLVTMTFARLLTLMVLEHLSPTVTVAVQVETLVDVPMRLLPIMMQALSMTMAHANLTFPVVRMPRLVILNRLQQWMTDHVCS